MATQGPLNLPAYFNVDADFRSWGSGISTALAALGLVQTADTGQINWTTVLKPTGATAQGYEIWRFADALQSTVPVFFKLEYGGSSGVGATGPGLWLTVGTGTNGAGTLTGQVSGRPNMYANAGKSAGVLLPTYVCGSTSEFYLATNVDTYIGSTNFGFFASVARTKDTSGTNTSDGAVLMACWGGGANIQIVPPMPAPVSNSSSIWPTVAPMFFQRWPSGTIEMCPVILAVPGNWRFSRICVTPAYDLPAAGSFTATIFGGTHTYMALGNALTSTQTVTQQTPASTYPGVAMPWE
jgi:hypothetical protein